MIRNIHSLFISLYCLSIHIVAPFNKKAKQWVEGRKAWRSKLESKLKFLPKERIWMHCSSLGEFEQGRPVLDALRREYPSKVIILSFFSPSGYNIRKNYPGADVVSYLPCDTRQNAITFVKMVKPELSIFVKYDLWLNYFIALKELKLPIIIISVLIKQPLKGVFQRLYNLRCYQLMDKIFVQDQQSLTYLASAGISHTEVAGDTRIDRVTALPLEASNKDLSAVELFKDNKKLMVCGSTWPRDEEVLMSLFESPHFNDWKAIIAPHEIDNDKIIELENNLGSSSIRLSKLDFDTAANYRYLIVDSVGQLSTLYSQGTLAYIGGGFGKGIHNTLEPAAFVLPVIIGPQYKKFQEANHLVSVKAFISILNKEQ
ncbi:MAG TPA: glycosyltransferase N-terminal domain-containing protein, partial [Saprospiraceae bacterium]|nr:glycosyltransferase N-terminal domain-containing protein [Saprospiraceae bacterium]